MSDEASKAVWQGPTQPLPSLRIPGSPPLLLLPAPSAALPPLEAQQQQRQQQQQQPSSWAWKGAFEEASLMGSLSSPMGSAAYGRSFSAGAGPGQGELWWARGEGEQQAEAGPESDEARAERWAAVRHEARSLCRLALPMGLTNLAAFLITVVMLSVAGRLGKFELASMVLGTSVYNVTGMSLLMGFAAAMETLCGQAFGARNYRMVGIVFQRALILTTVVSAAVALVWMQAEGLLLFFRQDPLLSRSAARYIQLTIPALYCTGLFEACKRYLMAQGVVRPQSAVTLVGLALAPLYSWFFIFKLDWRLDGAAWAVDAIQLTMAALLGGYILFRDTAVLKGLPHATWHGWSMEALRGWLTYLRFALPSVVLICCEWWCFEAMILMSGWLAQPDVAVAVMGICINSSGIIWMVVTGFAMACSTRVSNSLGAGCPRTARRATWTAVAITTVLELAAMGAILALRRHWAMLFTDSPEVVFETAALLPIFALTLPGDGANATLQGLLRGSGRQETGAVTNLCSYWLLGIPAAYFLAFKQHLGVRGLWWGLVIGTLMLIIALRFNFEKEALKARARTSVAHHPLPDEGINGGSGLAEPLLGGPQCERLEQGLMAAEAPAAAEEAGE